MHQITQSDEIGVYIELDVLLDTRFATLRKMDEDLAFDIIKDDAYFLRDADAFEGVDERVFKDLYSKRDIETLKLSMLTNFTLKLEDLFLDIREGTIGHPFYSKVRCIINHYPYQLSDQDKVWIKSAIARYIRDDKISISMLYIPPEDQTVSFFKKNTTHMFVYDILGFVDSVLKSASLVNIMPLKVVYFPMLLYNKKITEEEDSVIKKHLQDAGIDNMYTFYMEIFSALVKVNFIPIYMYSIYNDMEEHYYGEVPHESITETTCRGSYSKEELNSD